MRSTVIAVIFAISLTSADAGEVSQHLQQPAEGAIYKGALGDPVVAAESGTVVLAGREGGYGKYVRIDHGDGLQTAYAHLQTFNVKTGQCVSKGEVIGSIGESGIASGVHLHFEVIKDSRFADPSTLLPNRS